MKGTPSPMASESPFSKTSYTQGPAWDNSPVGLFNKFDKQPVCAWDVPDGTLSDGSAPDGVPGDLWKKKLRSMEDIDCPRVSHPTWKTTDSAIWPIMRQPKGAQRL